jgi:hypothetical protein
MAFSPDVIVIIVVLGAFVAGVMFERSKRNV